VPITVLLYDGPLLRGFNVAIKGLVLHNPVSSLVLLHCAEFFHIAAATVNGILF